MTSRTHAVLAGFRPVVLQRPVPQNTLLSYTAWLLATARCAAARTRSQQAAEEIATAARAAVLRFGVKPEHIANRQFNVFPEEDEQLGALGRAPALPPRFADLVQNPGGPTVEERMNEFRGATERVFRQWYMHQSEAPEHLLHVTCSGYMSPSPAQRWVSGRGWHGTAVTHCYHMGCYAAFPAIRTAVALIGASLSSTSDAQRRVDIMHTEYLSLHFNPLLHEPSHIIDTTLFGDGFIGYSAYSADAFSALREPGLRPLSQLEVLIPDSLEEMSWTLGPRQFDMHLSKNVPVAIERAIVPFMRKLCARAECDFERDKPSMLFAIHPGGPKILEHARLALGLTEDQVRHSREVFHELGNMSSATIPHVFLRLLADESVRTGTRIASVAFGPGLTATGFILEKVAPKALS